MSSHSPYPPLPLSTATKQSLNTGKHCIFQNVKPAPFNRGFPPSTLSYLLFLHSCDGKKHLISLNILTGNVNYWACWQGNVRPHSAVQDSSFWRLWAHRQDTESAARTRRCVTAVQLKLELAKERVAGNPRKKYAVIKGKLAQVPDYPDWWFRCKSGYIWNVNMFKTMVKHFFCLYSVAKDPGCLSLDLEVHCTLISLVHVI